MQAKKFMVPNYPGTTGGNLVIAYKNHFRKPSKLPMVLYQFCRDFPKSLPLSQDLILEKLTVIKINQFKVYTT